MIGGIVFLIVGLIFIGLFITYLVLWRNDMKAAGPTPWHFGYDKARKERVMREEMINRSKEKTQVNIKGLDEYLT